MRGIEWMPQQYPFGTGGRILDVADQDTRRTRRNKAVGGGRRGNLGQKIALYINPFRTVLLDECTALDRAHDIGVKAQPASRGARGEAHMLERGPKPVDECP
jgi:hypothetical protein